MHFAMKYYNATFSTEATGVRPTNKFEAIIKLLRFFFHRQPTLALYANDNRPENLSNSRSFPDRSSRGNYNTT